MCLSCALTVTGGAERGGGGGSPQPVVGSWVALEPCINPPYPQSPQSRPGPPAWLTPPEERGRG